MSHRNNDIPKPNMSRRDIERQVALVTNGSAFEKTEAVRALGNLARVNAASRTAIGRAGGIPPLVALVRSGAARGQEEAASALMWIGCNNAANQAAIREAGGIAALVALATNGAAGGQKQAAWAFSRLAHDNAANRVAIREAGGIPPVVALVRSGAADCQEAAVMALGNLAYNNPANQAAIVAAGAVGPLVALVRVGAIRLGGHSREAEWALKMLDLAAIASRLQTLQAEKASSRKRQLAEDVVDLCDGDAPPPEKKRTLRDMVDEEKDATLNRIKLEKADAAGEAEEAQDTLGYQVRFTDALQTKIDELHALASQVDPVAADAIKNRANQ